MRRVLLWVSSVGVALGLAACGTDGAGVDGGRVVRPDTGPPQCRTVTYSSLLDETSSLAALARQSVAPFTLLEASSYDRASTDPRNTTTWFANYDRGHFLRTEARAGRTEYVMMEHEGPGAIVRVWSANPAGVLRVYLDDAESPAIEGNMTDLLSGTHPDFPSPFGEITARGGNLYAPLPFARRAKVTIDSNAGDGLFYQVHFRAYEACTVVEPYVPGVLAALAPTLTSPAVPTDGSVREVTLDAATPRLELAAEPGGGEVIELSVLPSLLTEDALRATVMTWTFDGEETVRAPLGDFFGGGPGLLPHRTLAQEVTADGRHTSRFVMPYRESAVLVIEPAPGMRVQVRVRQRAAAWRDDSLHFWAQWVARPPTATQPFADAQLASLRGSGHLVGIVLDVTNPSPFWWGEGDEKVFVDGEAFPSQFGTGTEDYFGYAWSDRSLFSHPYHAQTRVPNPPGPGELWGGRTSNERLHVLDRTPFTAELRFDLEVWHWDGGAALALDAVAYFYARPGARSQLEVVPRDRFVVPPLP